MDVNVGVVNPYAVAELVADKQIRWSRVANPVAELSNIMQLPEETIFAPDSPLLRPGVVPFAKPGEIQEILPKREAQARLADFLKSNLSGIELAHPRRLRTLREDQAEPLAQLLVQPEVGSNSEPWQPSGVDWVDKGDFYEDLGEINDPVQGALGNCYFIAAMSSVAWSRPYAIANFARPSSWGDDNAPIHQVTFYDGGKGDGETVEVSERLPVSSGSHRWRYARSRDHSETWPAVLEKAYSKWRTGNTTDFPDYGPTAGGDPVMACAQIVRGERHHRWNANHSRDELYSFVRQNSRGKRTFNPVVAWTPGRPPEGLDFREARVVASHAYSVLGWEWRNNTPYIVLRNPWGTHEVTADVLSGSWTSFGPYTAPMPLNTDGVFAMKASMFKQYFAGLGWVV